MDVHTFFRYLLALKPLAVNYACIAYYSILSNFCRSKKNNIHDNEDLNVLYIYDRFPFDCSRQITCPPFDSATVRAGGMLVPVRLEEDIRARRSLTGHRRVWLFLRGFRWHRRVVSPGWCMVHRLAFTFKPAPQCAHLK